MCEKMWTNTYKYHSIWLSHETWNIRIETDKHRNDDLRSMLCVGVYDKWNTLENEVQD